MMPRLPGATLTILLGACGGASPVVTVEAARVTVAPAGARTAAVHASLVNRGRAADTLLALSSDVAGRGSVHRYVASGGMTVMEQVNRVVIPAGGTVELRSGGMHGMLEDLGGDVRPGATIHLTFTFAIAPPAVVRVTASTVTDEDR